LQVSRVFWIIPRRWLECQNGPQAQELIVQRISSRLTVYYKRIFPAAFFGILAFVAVAPVLTGLRTGEFPPPTFFLFVAVFIALAYIIMKMLVFDLVDEVLDDGDALIVRNGASKGRISLKDIKNVSYSPLLSPPRVALSLRRPGIFGEKVTFCAPMRLIPFATSPIVEALIDRVDAARK
jgi:hypothetical protein